MQSNRALFVGTMDFQLSSNWDVFYELKFEVVNQAFFFFLVNRIESFFPVLFLKVIDGK